MSSTGGQVLALSGGVGGAKLALGLSSLLAQSSSLERLLVVANTGDDFALHGLYICPDLDTVMYTLAGAVNTEFGWGRKDESWNFLDALTELGGETWFRLGDKDMATHVLRTERLHSGASLCEVTAELSAKLGVAAHIAPMTNDPVHTRVMTQSGELHFQHYFVRDRCQPTVTGFRFDGIEAAQPSPPLVSALKNDDLAAILVCPSNPMVSVDPIFDLPGVTSLIQGSRAPLVAVSPIIGGQAVKGPAAKMLQELNMPVSALGVAQHYAARGVLDGFVIDHEDRKLDAEIQALGAAVLVTQTLMTTLEDRERLAQECLEFAATLRGPSSSS